MIKVNLLGEVKTGDHSQTLYFLGYFASVLIVTVTCIIFYSAASSRLEEVKGDNSLLEMQLKKLKEQTKSVADLEKRKNDLNEKLRVIALLKRSKMGPVRVLDDLNLSIPDRSWLISLKEGDSILRIAGFALDNQTIASFMKDLAQSEYFETVDLEETKVAQREGLKIKSFALQARVNYAGKIKATTAVIQPVAAQPAAENLAMEKPAAEKPAVETVVPSGTPSATEVPLKKAGEEL
jgi:type IV pilus assembly protein PilN